MRIRILVANQNKADFYDVEHRGDVPRPAGHLLDPAARLHDRDFKSDRPGRVFDHAPSPAGRRGATAHHATGGAQSPRQHETELFASRIAREIERGFQAQEFERLIIMAGPPLLGVLRAALEPLPRCPTWEIGKDLVRQPLEAISEHLPVEAFVPELIGQS